MSRTEPGLVVLHEGWGRTADIDSVVDRFRSRGWRVDAPDLFEGTGAMRSLSRAPYQLVRRQGSMFDVARQAVDDARRRGPAAVLGLSLGAAIALRLRFDGPLVVAYGHVPRRILASGPTFGVYGSNDRLTARSGRRLERSARAAVVWVEGAGHSFLVDPTVGLPLSLPGFGPHPGATEAWAAIDDFLDCRLR